VEVVPKQAQEVDVVEIFMAGEAVSQIVFRIDVNEQRLRYRAAVRLGVPSRIGVALVAELAA